MRLEEIPPPRESGIPIRCGATNTDGRGQVSGGQLRGCVSTQSPIPGGETAEVGGCVRGPIETSYALDKTFADQEVSQAFCLQRLKSAITLAKWFHEELAGMLTVDTGYRSRGALDRILNWINSCRGSMVSQGDINENGIGIDKFRTIWSLFPDQLLGWKSFSERGRPTLFFGTSG